jgi:hypothetical protein
MACTNAASPWRELDTVLVTECVRSAYIPLSTKGSLPC